MPPAELIAEVLLKAVLPAAALAALLLGVIEFLGGKQSVAAAAALALAAGVGLGFWLCGTVELASGSSRWNQLPWAALAALGVGVSLRLPGVPSAVAWITKAVCAAAIAWFVIPPETRADGWWFVPGFAVVVFAEWALLERLAARPPDGSIAAALALSALTAAAVLVHAGSTRLMEANIVLAAALGGLSAAAWWRRLDVGAAVPGAVVLLAGVALFGQQSTYTEISWTAFLLAAAAPLTLAVSLPLWRLHGARLLLVRLALLLPPLVAAAVLAAEAGPLMSE
ncbi:MAG: hypothetical protein L0Y71_09875 [Gemmataceae bacterium]|nr:hypothetical protein [Gemmataceae bacterium]